MKPWRSTIVIIGLFFSYYPVASAKTLSCDWVAGYDEGADATILAATLTSLPCGDYTVEIGGLNIGLEAKAASVLIINCTDDDPVGTYYGFPVLSNLSATAGAGVRLSFGYVGSNGYCVPGGFGVWGAGATVGIVPILTIRRR